MFIFTGLCRELRETSSKKKKLSILQRYLSQLSPEEREALATLLLSQVEGYTFKTVTEAIGDFSKFYRGDVHEAVVKHLSSLRYRQRSLTAGTLSLTDIVNSLKSASRENRTIVLKSIVGSMDIEDAAFLIAALLSDLRVGVARDTFVQAMARICGVKEENIKRYASLSPLRDIVRCRFNREIAPLIPFSPMLAEKAESFEDIWKRGNIWAEPKLDGVRVLVHKKGGEVKIFSRRGKDMTPLFPEIVRHVSKIPGDLILDGEVIALEQGRILPFQNIMRRFSERRNVSIDFFFFDIPYHNAPLTDRSYESRREILESLTDKYVPRERIVSVEFLEKYFRKSISMGYEGLVCKHPNGAYLIGERDRNWLKIKRVFEIDAVIVAAEWGHGRRRSWLSDYHLALWKDGELVEVGKTFKGLNDKEMEMLTRRLLEKRIGDIPGGILVAPSIVVEVEFEDVQLSPKYEKYTLRFARVKRIKEDKDIHEAGKIEEIERIYRQLHSQSRYP